MNYRLLGRSGLQVSEIGLGCEHLETLPYETICSVFDAAFEGGINIADVFMSEPQVRSDIGRVLKGRRQRMILQGHFGAVWKNGQYGRSRDLADNKRFFEDLLRRLDTDYIDIGMLHCIDTDEEFDAVFDHGIVDYALSLKKQGALRTLGISTHDAAIGLRAVESGVIDVVLFSINPAYDLLPEGLGSTEPLFDEKTYQQPLFGVHPRRDEFYRACENANIGITVMKSLAAGSLLDASRSPFGLALTPAQCIHYAMTRPAVGSVLVGVRSAAELRQALEYETASDEEKDYSVLLASTPQFSLKGKCMYCNHCLPCPARLNIAQINKLFDLAQAAGGSSATVNAHYDSLAHHASECLACRACEARCPFGVPISSRMAQAAQVFGK